MDKELEEVLGATEELVPNDDYGIQDNFNTDSVENLYEDAEIENADTED